MKTKGLAALLIGIIILIVVVFKLSIFSGFFVELVLAAVFFINGLDFFRKKKSEELGSLVFGIFLALDAFKVFKVDFSFWQYFLILVAVYMICAGIISAFKPGKSSFKFEINNDTYEIESFQAVGNETKHVLYNNLDWTKVNINSSVFNEAFKVKTSSMKDIYKYEREYENGVLEVKNKLKVSNIKVPERAKTDITLNKKLPYSYEACYSVCESTMDFRALNINEVKIDATASKIICIPSDLVDSNIHINMEITSLTVRVPKDVALYLKNDGELTIKSIEGLTKREDGSYVSMNFTDAKVTCTMDISSEMSRLSIQII